MSDALDFRFIVEDEDGNRNVVPVQAGVLRVGRQADNEICLPDRNVSRRHAKIALQPDGSCALEDLNSYNGVFVNGERVNKTGRLVPGDTLRIGDFQLELRHAARRTDNLTNTAQHNLLGKEGTEPAGLTAQAAALANETTTPAGDVMANERTDVSGRISAEPTDPGVPRGDADGADEPTSPGIEVTDRAHLLGESDGPDTARDLDGPSSMRTEVLRRPGARAGRDKRSDASGPEAPYAHLLCLSGERAGTPFPLSKAKIVIGRTEENDIALDHRSISREHSRVEWTHGGFRIVDLDSSNGTLVNNESYQQVELHAGDVVELGHIRLRFVGAGEPCVLSQEERMAVAKELRGSPAFSGSRWPLAIGGAGLACLVTVAVMYWTQAHAPAPLPVPPAPAPTAAAPQAPVPDEAQSLLSQAQAALATKNYARAQALATAALAIDPSRREAQGIVRQAAGEERAVQSIEAATSAVDGHAWADAFNALQDLPPGSGHKAEAQQLMAQIKPALLRERIEEAKTALGAGDLDEVALLVDEVEALEPEAGTLSELRHALEVARRRADGKAKPVRTRAAAAPAHAAPLHKDKAPVRNNKPAPAAARPAPRAAPSDEASAAARAAYSDGTRLLAGSQTQKAIEAFGRCVAADKTFAMCYRALGIAYAKADNGPKAVHFYRLYLKVDPNARDAAQVRQLLQQYNQQATEATDASK